VVLSSNEMADLIRRMREVFDLIIFDTPPVLSVADALALASHADATILIAGAGKTDTEELEQTANELREANADVVGAVLNRFNPSEPSEYSSKYRYEDYGYRPAAG
jgi:Mrp family chromosome partitioning ATPase